MSDTTPVVLFGNNITAVDAAGSTAADADYPLANILTPSRPLRKYQTGAGVTEATVLFETDPTYTNKYLFLDNCNFTTVGVYSGTTTASYAFGVTLTLTEDALTGRYKCFADFEDLAITLNHYIKLVIPTQTPIKAPSNAYFIGGAWVCPNNDTLLNSNNWYLDFPGGLPANYTIDVHDPYVEVEFSGGGSEFIELGEKYVSIGMDGLQYVRSSQEASVLSILNKRSAPFVFSENQGDQARTYVVRVSEVETVSVEYVVGKVLTLPFRFREQI